MKSLSLLLWAAVLACGSAPPAEQPVSASRSAPPVGHEAPSEAAPVSEPAVPSSLNARFLDPNLKVEDWVKRFEGESREIAMHRDAIVKALPIEKGATIADIGAGTGLFEPLFASAVGPRGRVFAVDISPRFLDHLRRRKSQEAWNNVEVIEGSAKSPRLGPSSVDVVFVCDTYHHFEHVPETLAAIHTALRPGGRIVVIDFHRVPGKSRPWLLEHVRAGQDVFRRELEAAGFTSESDLEIDGLEDNYAMVLRKKP